VVGAAEVQPADDHVMVGSRRLQTGDLITIDGSSGAVYLGGLAGRWEVAPEAATLLQWAHELGIEIGGPTERTERIRDKPHVGDVSAGDVIRLLSIKGVTRFDALADALMVAPDALRPTGDQLVIGGLVELTDDGMRLTAAGKDAAATAFAANAQALGSERGAELLEEFHLLDERVKAVVTSWQIRNVGVEQSLNDHLDASYDAKVLADLTGLHLDASGWLLPLSEPMTRFAVYARRLERALDLARSWDQRYVASPRVDSYHSVWFELHEDLIRLAGRTRTE
jgi:pyruvate,orthophosphate dikinase